MLINIFGVFSIATVVLLELTVPLLISNYLVIPSNRLVAAHWVFQFSIISYVFSTMTIPYTSSIIAYERMNVYAYFTIVDVFGKLAILAALFYSPIDRLITFSLLSTCITCIVNIWIVLYGKFKLPGCLYSKYWDSSLFKRMSSFAGWNLFGSASWVLNNQGQAIILNLFFGPVVNAAKAVADRINQIIVSFCNNFYMAVNPQITKTYASGNFGLTKNLVLTSSKLSFFLMLVLCLPVQFNMRGLLYLWLGETQVSEEMILFSIWVLCFTLINSLETPLSQTIRATGNIKRYQIQIGVQTLSFLPVTYICFCLGCPAYYSMIVLCSVYLIAHFSRIRIVGPIINMNFYEYTKNVFFPIIRVTPCCMALLYCATYFVSTSILTLIIRITISFAIVLATVLIFGLSKKERMFVYSFIRNKWHHE